MRILIFGIPRSGTSSLFKFLTKSLPKNYTISYEPYKRLLETPPLDNLLVKTVLTDEIILKNGETLLDHSKRIIEQFDKIIYIKRKNIHNTIKSFSDFQQPDLPKEISDIDSDEKIRRWTTIFNELTIGKKIYYYENIYTEKPSEEIIERCNYLNIDFNQNIFNKTLHLKNKEMDEKKIRTII